MSKLKNKYDEKIIKAYCISKVEKGVRSFQPEGLRIWSTDICHAHLYKDKKECESWIKGDIEGWKSYQTFCPASFKIPEYEIIEVELKVLNQIKFCK